MSTFQENLIKIQTSIYGEDMRLAIHDAIEQAYDRSEELIDNTLTKENHSADAKSVGDVINNIENVITENKKSAASVIYEDTSGPIASFTDGADGGTVKALTIGIEPNQSGRGDPSPDNVCPITGWTGVNVTRTGKNLFGGTLLRDGIKASMPDATVNEDEKYISFTAGAVIVQNITQECGLTNKFKELTPYTVIMTIYKSSGNGTNLAVYYTDGSFAYVPGVSSAGIKETIVLVTSANKTVAYINKRNNGGTTRLYYEESGIFEGVLTADDFVPYEGTTYPVSWETEAGTVYGGEYDVFTGKMTVKMAKITFDGTESFTRMNTGAATLFRYKLGDLNTKINPAGIIKCNIFPYNRLTVSNTMVGVYGVNSSAYNGDYIHIRPNNVYDESTDTAMEGDEFKAMLANLADAGTPCEVTYTLHDPIVYEIAPYTDNILTLLGLNNIFADCGPIDALTYPADTKLYIDKGQTEDDMTANAPIANGAYFMIGNTLYRATAAIATDETIQPGTNCTITTIAEALNALAE